LAGCLGGGSTPAPLSGDRTDPAGSAPGGDAGGPPLAAATLPLSYDAATLRSRTVSGGPPKDGIPSIDAPQFESAAAADWIPDGEVVFGVLAGGQARAYPRQILVSHEIVNDTLPGRPTVPGSPGDPAASGESVDDPTGQFPVAVTYCPLTGTAQGFERGTTTFGVSGRLVNSNLVMYDRATDSRWPQVLATAVEGLHEGRSLREFQVVWTPWGRWRDRYPDTVVLSRETGFVRSYDRDPYGGGYDPLRGYYATDRLLFGPLTPDDRLPRKVPVVGVRTTDGVAAFDKAAVLQAGVVEGAVGEVPHLAVADPSLATVWVYRNPERARFDPIPDDEDGRVSGPDGESVRPDAIPLDRVIGFDAMWFAWAGYYPETPLYGRLGA
jgi:hypothetical protein